MRAAMAAEQQAESSSTLNLLLQRIEQEASEGQTAAINAEEASLLVDLAKRYAKLKFRDANRIAIDRAKEIVADQVGCRLSDAFHWIQKKAGSKNKTLEETVEMILLADDMRRESEAGTGGQAKRREG